MGIGGVPIDKDKVITAIRLKKGILSQAAKLVPCDVRTIYNLMKSDPEVAEVVREAREYSEIAREDRDEELKEELYDSAFDLVKKRDVTMTIFGLKAKCKWNQDAHEGKIVVELNDKPYKQENK